MVEAVASGATDVVVVVVLGGSSHPSNIVCREFVSLLVAVSPHRALIPTQEYAYWLILAEWNYFDVSGNRDSENITGNSEFSLGTSDEIRDQLPIGHKLYVDYIEKILTEPDKQLIESLFE